MVGGANRRETLSLSEGGLSNSKCPNEANHYSKKIALIACEAHSTSVEVNNLRSNQIEPEKRQAMVNI